jgi:glycosyltransferase involved in cell wall biosynthesis
MDRRRVALITHRYAPEIGGVELHVQEIAKRLYAHGWTPEVLTQAPRDLPRTATVDGISVRRFPALGAASAYALAPSLPAFLAHHARDYTVLHAHNYHALPALATALSGRARLVVTPHYHGTGHTRLATLLHRPYRLAGRLLFKRAGRVICVSEPEARLLERDFPQTRGRVDVIPNGIDIDALRSALPFDTPGPVVVAAGRLQPYKRLDRVIDAVPHLPDSARLVVVGDGPEAASLRERIAGAGVADRTSLTGPVERPVLERWLRTADVFVSLSEQEAFGLGVAEGLGAGARVVASDIPAHRQIASQVPGGVRLVGADAGPAEVAEAIRAMLEPVSNAPSIDGLITWDDVARRTAAVYDLVTTAARG